MTAPEPPGVIALGPPEPPEPSAAEPPAPSPAGPAGPQHPPAAADHEHRTAEETHP
ncbi:hypothetical protein ACWGNM_09480 [Streptomyces sp. NPDC055796]